MKNVHISVFILFSSILIFLFLINAHLFAQEHYCGNNFVTLKPGASEQQVVETAAQVTPSARQLEWQKLETTAFVHFGLNTFYNQEWGRGTEDPARFNPTLLNTDQWAKEISEAGFKMLIMTCKHHDGFCLWPSKYTNHSVASSPWMNGKGDLVKQVSESCRKYKMKFGIYLSPWDRHETSYGNSSEYNKFFLNQLTELLTNYGIVDEVWFDGACGEGPNGRKQIYDWESYYSLIRKLQPDAVIAVMGPDVRWVGTENGYGRETEWSVVPYEQANQERIAGESQQSASEKGFLPPGDMVGKDLGSRLKLKDAKNLIWYPSEVDVSIRPGWFWHQTENDRVKSPEKLMDIYFSSVGRNSQLLLNIPPDSLGLINDEDVRSLQALKNGLNSIFKDNLAADASIKTIDKALNINTITDNTDSTSWKLIEKIPFSFVLNLKAVSDFDILLLQENITIGQRIEKFTLEAWINNNWEKVAEGTTVGYKRLLRFPLVHTNKIRLTIEQSRLAPALAEFGLYRQLPAIIANPPSASFRESVEVNLSCNAKDAAVYYTTDGSFPDLKSNRYNRPLKLTETTNLRFIAIRKDGTSGFAGKTSYLKANYGIMLANAPDEKYSGSGPLGLIDGIYGTIDFADGQWIGFNGTNMEAIIDLGKVQELNEFGINFNENTKSWIFRPQQVEFLISEDNLIYKTIFAKTFDKPAKDNEQLLHISFNDNCKARFVKVKATNFGKLPDWHTAKGEPAWLFVDEIVAK